MNVSSSVEPDELEITMLHSLHKHISKDLEEQNSFFQRNFLLYKPHFNRLLILIKDLIYPFVVCDSVEGSSLQTSFL